MAGPNVTFHGANVHIVNGAGQTPSINGLGNLIIGYDEYPSTFAAGDRGGSHNLIMGTQNKFTDWSWSGIINGDNNLIAAQECVILTGANGRIYSNVSPGYSAYGFIGTGLNQTIFDGQAGTIVGGTGNYIGYLYDVILGGTGNTNGGVYSVVLGGTNNSVQHYVGIDQDIIIPTFSITSGISFQPPRKTSFSRRKGSIFMKITSLLLLAFMASAASLQAQTVAQLQAEITALKAQVAALLPLKSIHSIGSMTGKHPRSLPGMVGAIFSTRQSRMTR